MTTKPEEKSAWELESGLPNDVDGIMTNCRFGTPREEYAMQVVAGGGAREETLMFLTDLVNEAGEELGQAGWSVGSGWKASDDGTTISHPTRKNVVISSRYGQLQYRVVKELGVDMEKYGKPTIAASWNGLNFHWMMELHDTLKVLQDGSKEKKQGLMPTAFNGVNEKFRGGAAPAGVAKAAGPKIDPKLERQLKELAQTNPFKEFVKAAMKIPAVSQNDDLMSSVMDDTATGFFAQHQR
jgi:hypothetical protein